MGVKFYCPECGVVPDEGLLFCRKDGLKLTMKTTSLGNIDLTDEVKKLEERLSGIKAEMQKETESKTEDKEKNSN